MQRIVVTMTLSAIAAVLLALAAWGCAINPATGKRQLVLIGEAEEVQLGLESDREIVKQMGLYPDDDLQAYVAGIGRGLASRSERADLNWTFRVVDDTAVNAFALPGGFIYVTRGILAHFNNEAELAAVLGHEIGHVTARHSVNQMSKAQLASIGLGVGMIVSEDLQRFGALAETSLGLMFLKFSRDDERQADDLGLRYVSRSTYDPREMPGMFDMLQAVGEASGGGRLPGWISTHPTPENRRERLEEQIRSGGQDFGGRDVRREEYLARLDNMVFGVNPREGFFRDESFLHPEMEFRLDFPAGWTTQNRRAVVVAVSPDKDAIVQLTLASESTPDEALAKFFEPQAVSRGARWTRPVHGLTVAGADFTVTRDQGGNLRGQVLFVAYGGRVFGLLGYAADANWGKYATAVGDSLASFDRLTERAALEVEPARLRIVKPPSAMSVDEFGRRYNSSAEPATLALINRLPRDGRVEPGRSYKVVVGGKLP